MATSDGYCDGYCGTSGITPITVWGLSFIRKVWPTTLGSPPKLRSQYLLLNTSTAGAPGPSSAATNVRP